MSPTNSWTDARIDDFMRRYAEDQERTEKTLERIEAKVDSRRWSPALLVSLFGPIGVALIGAVALIVSRGG